MEQRCPHCGQLMEHAAPFCVHCGQPAEIQRPYESKRQRKKDRRLPWMIAVAVLVVINLILGVLFVLRMTNRSDESSPVTTGPVPWVNEGFDPNDYPFGDPDYDPVPAPNLDPDSTPVPSPDETKPNDAEHPDDTTGPEEVPTGALDPAVFCGSLQGFWVDMDSCSGSAYRSLTFDGTTLIAYNAPDGQAYKGTVTKVEELGTNRYELTHCDDSYTHRWSIVLGSGELTIDGVVWSRMADTLEQGKDVMADWLSDSEWDDHLYEVNAFCDPLQGFWVDLSSASSTVYYGVLIEGNRMSFAAIPGTWYQIATITSVMGSTGDFYTLTLEVQDEALGTDTGYTEPVLEQWVLWLDDGTIRFNDGAVCTWMGSDFASGDAVMQRYFAPDAQSADPNAPTIHQQPNYNEDHRVFDAFLAACFQDLENVDFLGYTNSTYFVSDVSNVQNLYVYTGTDQSGEPRYFGIPRTIPVMPIVFEFQSDGRAIQLWSVPAEDFYS